MPDQKPKPKSWTTRLPQETVDRLKKLAEYEGRPLQEVADNIIRQFLEAIGPIPEKKSFLKGPWPGPKPPKKTL